MEERDNNKRWNRQTWLGQPNQIKVLSQPEVPDPKYKCPTHAGWHTTRTAHRSYQPVSPTRWEAWRKSTGNFCFLRPKTTSKLNYSSGFLRGKFRGIARLWCGMNKWYTQFSCKALRCIRIHPTPLHPPPLHHFKFSKPKTKMFKKI